MLLSTFSNETNRAHRWSFASLLREKQNRWDRILSIVLILAVLGAMGAVIYIAVTPKIEGRFTEFYILGLEGSANNYPSELIPGEAGRVDLGIVNRENETRVYRVEVTVGNEKVNEIGSITLEHEEGWEQEVAFVCSETGLNQKVEFCLYEPGQTEAYRSLHLWVDVKDKLE